MKSRAFTLIELLIVVAIIAILAAIAVPNFLEAQVRSKVARVKADMRSVATAMEACAVDANHYPIPSDGDGAFIVNPAGATMVSPMETKLPILLTTPVAYLSSRFSDPFAKARVGEPELYHCVTMDFIDLRMNFAPVHNWRNVFRDFYQDAWGEDPPQAVRYYLESFGPDKDHDVETPHVTATSGPHVHGSGAVYDPTNGTVSSGDIFYLGPGLGFRD